MLHMHENYVTRVSSCVTRNIAITTSPLNLRNTLGNTAQNHRNTDKYICNKVRNYLRKVAEISRDNI